ncbi:hypothetical protein WL84_25485 [Burkholderia cenocepacia]|nr:hypothetical protein WL84_25485 [Burkholderia cenocepacia]ODN64942.1 hypothetical protein BA763_14875 [Burkholderia cenocepacia]
MGREERLGAGAIAVAGLALLGPGFRMVAHLGREHALGQALPELAGQAPIRPRIDSAFLP